MLNRRDFLLHSTLSTLGLALGSRLAGCASTESCSCCDAPAGPFRISLAEWSFHRALKAGRMDNLDFPQKARSFGIDGCEYVNQFFPDKARDEKYLAELKKRCEGEGVASVLIMCDREGNLGDADAKKRTVAVENHYKWIDAGKFLGCHSIRVNAASDPKLSYEEQQKLAADGLRRLTEYGAKQGLNVIVENHGGLSSNGKWLAGVMKLVGHPRVGTLPDFGNFNISPKNAKGPAQIYDKYQGVTELMPFAKGVSAKSHEFNAQGEEVNTDYRRMMKIVMAAGYHNWVGIEYEGSTHSEDQGVVLTLKLLRKIQAELAGA